MVKGTQLIPNTHQAGAGCPRPTKLWTLLVRKSLRVEETKRKEYWLERLPGWEMGKRDFGRTWDVGVA